MKYVAVIYRPHKKVNRNDFFPRVVHRASAGEFNEIQTRHKDSREHQIRVLTVKGTDAKTVLSERLTLGALIREASTLYSNLTEKLESIRDDLRWQHDRGMPYEAYDAWGKFAQIIYDRGPAPTAQLYYDSKERAVVCLWMNGNGRNVVCLIDRRFNVTWDYVDPSKPPFPKKAKKSHESGIPGQTPG